MKKNILTFALLLAGIISGGCALFCDVAEFHDLKQPVVQYREFQEGMALHVEGTISQSSGKAVEYVRQYKDGGNIHIEVLVSPFERDHTGISFQTDVFLDGVDRITFGKDRTLLWRRNPEKNSTLPSKAKPVFKREE